MNNVHLENNMEWNIVTGQLTKTNRDAYSTHTLALLLLLFLRFIHICWHLLLLSPKWSEVKNYFFHGMFIPCIAMALASAPKSVEKEEREQIASTYYINNCYFSVSKIFLIVIELNSNWNRHRTINIGMYDHWSNMYALERYSGWNVPMYRL